MGNKAVFHIHPIYTNWFCGKDQGRFDVYCTNIKDVDCPDCKKAIEAKADE